MVTCSGNITLNSVTDKEMEIIWGFKAKHGSNFLFNPAVIQPVMRQNLPAMYNNVNFSYSDLHGFNLIAEIVNELHKKEETKAVGQ